MSESFGFEERWIRLLLKNIPDHPDIFWNDRMEDAQYLLGGLGNRQVLALKDWARAIGLIIEEKKEKQAKFVLTPLGKIITQYDPKLDENGTFWAIHHNLCLSENKQIWFYPFYSNTFGIETFTREQMERHLREARPDAGESMYGTWLNKLTHTMKSTKLGNDLGILVPVDKNLFERRSPDSSLNYALIAYILCDWAEKFSRDTVNLLEFQNKNGVFRYLALSDTQAKEFLDIIQDRFSKKILWFSRTAGLNSIVFEPNVPSLAVLRAYYLQQLEGMEPLKALEEGIKLEQS